MATVQELRDKLRKPLERELLTGCSNRVVAGGVEKLLEHLGKPFPQVREALRGYAAMDEDERGERLRAALALLSDAPRPSTERSTGARSAPPVTLDPTARLQPGDEVSKLDLGPGSVKKLHALGLRTVRDVLHHYPRKHEDRRALPNLQDVQDGEKLTVQGVVVSKTRRTPKPGMLILEAVLQDAWGQKVRCTWFSQPWVEKQLREGARLIVSGRAKRFGRTLQLGVEYFETEDEGKDSLSINRIVGVYDSKDGISQAFLRRAVQQCLARTDLGDYLTAPSRARYALTDLADALSGIHFPTDEDHLTRAMARLRFDEYLFLELRVLLQGEEGVLLGKRFSASEQDMSTFEASLPFRFTGAQKRVLLEIADDMRSERQMARLVQGDVGSGKTAVAACALYLAARDGYQGALMAPTEILARQHFANLQGYLYPLGVRLGLLIGAMTGKQKAEMQRAIASGEIDVVIGTQALIQESVTFNNLGLAVVDEEHRFGVMQRRKLLQSRPDVLVMSATPIPRSLALTAYGDLELSIIDELPPGRTPIETKLLADTHRAQAYGFVMTQIREGRQAYVVASLIDESETLTELMAASALAENLRGLLPEARIALLHGKMSAAEKEDVMARFRAREFDLLVSTTVIEVGVDVPNSTVMVIENAERFGLAQLHQLRGRVGRGSLKSYCILIAGDHSKKTRQRLKVIEGNTDGFVIAEADLKLRGPGEIRGTRQSGLPDLKLGDIISDVEVIERARELAKAMLKSDPQLAHPRLNALKSELQERAAQVAYREVI
ncbi:ATP-dependent DNA helicase RecG [Deinococcus peraridilitoris]|uniref:ATP-dependent DNA helicase RecG n=1 Tax=Deinococcus peraridilitoris (strain DSM 19664 / LMG 22246 / CIP 109416 / KR-200) TaxID=937777 RepID=K9ZW97_DEIPD|nr:ATP-dependent DNA helicase RecG [Deinococcus peraridilitoris]AFZ65846.1 ATP-dependent DNA helicase RecG [Deinococcus peraridilitoris DSM 19664]